MDPVSQAFIGSAFAQTFAKKANQVKLAFGCGAIGGILPDIDIFIKSASDPLLAIQYHRHFTHSLFFVPIGGLVAAILIWLIFSRKKDNFLQNADVLLTLFDRKFPQNRLSPCCC